MKAPYVSTVFCDVCDTAIDGPVFWSQDVMVCGECSDQLREARLGIQKSETRQMSNVSWWTLLALGGVSGLGAYLIDGWPLGDGVMYLGLAGACFGGVLKLYGKIRG